MKPFVVAVATGLVVAVALVGVAVAQDSTLDVKTWDGQSRTLTDPSLQVVYTVLVEKDQQGTAPAGEAVAPGAPLELRGSMKALSSFLDQKLQSRWGLRTSDAVSIQKDGVETRVPLDQIQTLQFSRQPITRNSLPPYHAPRHFRYAATAVLRDGTRVEGDYVNLGATVLTGLTPQGPVEIPWEQIEIIRFGR